MGKQAEPKLEEVIVDLEDLLQVDEGELRADPPIVLPPPPPKGEFEGWEQGEEDLT